LVVNNFWTVRGNFRNYYEEIFTNWCDVAARTSPT